MGEKEVLNKAKWGNFPSINKALGHSYNTKEQKKEEMEEGKKKGRIT